MNETIKELERFKKLSKQKTQIIKMLEDEIDLLKKENKELIRFEQINTG